MTVTKENYYKAGTGMQYMSVSQFKMFQACEAQAIAQLRGDYRPEPSKALLMGSYVDAHFSGEMDEFVEAHPDIFNKRTGELKADYQACEQYIARAERDSLFMHYMDGDRQVILTGEIAGVPFKGKLDVLRDDAIVDLKLIRDMQPVWKDGEKKPFIDAWGYDLQGYVYQKLVEHETGKHLPFYLAVITKEHAPDIEIIHIPDWKLNACAGLIEHYAPRFRQIKEGSIAPVRCGACDYCKDTKRLTKPISYEALMEVEQ